MNPALTAMANALRVGDHLLRAAWASRHPSAASADARPLAGVAGSPTRRVDALA